MGEWVGFGMGFRGSKSVMAAGLYRVYMQS